MLLYDVPQTDQVTEPAMAALVARLRATSPKPEAIAPPDATIALHLTKAIGAITSAMGDRITPPILKWDGALDGVCIDLASRRVYNTRGRNRQAGADTSIDAVADDADAYLARLRPGGDINGKTENPTVVDSGNGVPRDAPYIMGSPTADGWIQRRAGRDAR
jgi:hypothetical protein